MNILTKAREVDVTGQDQVTGPLPILEPRRDRCPGCGQSVTQPARGGKHRLKGRTR